MQQAFKIGEGEIGREHDPQLRPGRGKSRRRESLIGGGGARTRVLNYPPAPGSQSERGHNARGGEPACDGNRSPAERDGRSIEARRELLKSGLRCKGDAVI